MSIRYQFPIILSIPTSLINICKNLTSGSGLLMCHYLVMRRFCMLCIPKSFLCILCLLTLNSVQASAEDGNLDRSVIYRLVNSLEEQMTLLDSLKVYNDLAGTYFEINIDSSSHYVQKVLKHKDIIPYNIYISSMTMQGMILTVKGGPYELARDCFEEAYQMSLRHEDLNLEGHVLSRISWLFWKRGLLHQAIEYAQKSKEIAANLDDSKLSYQACLYQGLVSLDVDMPYQALQYWEEALLYVEGMGDDPRARLYNNLACAHLALSDVDCAEQYLSAAKDVFLKNNNLNFLCLVHFNQGKASALKFDFNAAMGHFQEALQYNSKLQDKEREIMIKTKIAKIHLQKNEYVKAVKIAEAALNLSESINIPTYDEKLHNILGKTYAAIGDIKKSNEHINKLNSVLGNKIELRSAAYLIEMKYKQRINEREAQMQQLEKKYMKDELRIEKFKLSVSLLILSLVIILLGAIISYYRMRAKRLLELSRLRTRLSMDLHDNLGASLTQIRMLSNRMEQSQLYKNDKSDIAQKIKLISNEMMSGMYDMIWTLGSDSESLGSICNKMHDHLDSTLGEFDIRYSMEIGSLNLEKMIKVNKKMYIYSIFKEAVTNILKHTSSERVEIKLYNSAKENFILEIGNRYTKRISDKLDSGNHGINYMKQKAKDLGGALIINDTESFFKVTLKLEKL